MALYAEKGNKLLGIDEKETRQYQSLGFNIIDLDEKGNKELIAVGDGQTVPLAKYLELEKKYEKLKAEKAKPQK